jgi:hypothetical protein
MSSRNPVCCLTLLVALLVCAGTVAAQFGSGGGGFGGGGFGPSQSSVQLNISMGAGGATVSGSNATGLFSINFGNVNGLGLGTPAAGVSVVADASGALYKTPINLTTIYSNFSITDRATIEVEQGVAGDTQIAREGNSSISSASTVSPTMQALVASGITSGTVIQRYVGMYVSRTEAAGAKSVTLIYTITVE